MTRNITPHELESLLTSLTNSQTPSQIQSTLQTYLSSLTSITAAEDLQFLTTLLKHTIPIYKQLPQITRTLIAQCFQTTRALSNLVAQAKIAKHEVYLTFLKQLLISDSYLVKLLINAKESKFEINQIGALLFGGKVFNLFQGKLDVKEYLRLIISQLIRCFVQSLPVPGDYIIKLLALHPIEANEIFFKNMLTEQNTLYLREMVNRLTETQKLQLLTKHCIPLFLTRYLNEGNVSVFYNVLKDWQFKGIEVFLAKAVVVTENQVLQQLIIALIDDKMMVLQKLLVLWGDEQYSESTPSNSQIFFTTMLIFLGEKLSSNQKRQITLDPAFLNGVTKKLELQDDKLRNFVMMFVKVASNDEVKFDVPDDEQYKLQEVEITDNEDIEFQKLFEDFDNLSIAVKDTHHKSSQADSDDEDDDDGSEFADDTSNEAQPVFLKDLILRYNSDSIKSYTALLQTTITLTRKKSTFKYEIEFHSNELLSILVSSMNKYNEPKFEELKINAIVSLLVVNTKAINHLLELLFSGDYSLQQRMVILSAIGLAARELSGKDDEFIQKPQFDFPTEKIPHRAKEKALIQEIEQQPSSSSSSSMPKIQEIEQPSDIQISQGTVIRKSTKLTKPTKVHKPNKFAPIAHQWFYPLVEALRGGVNIGSFTEVFVKHYVNTLRLILGAAWPCAGFEEMGQVMEEVCTGVGVEV